MLVFRHPKYYKELRASQVKKAISPNESTDSDGRAPKATSSKLQATSISYKLQAASNRLTKIR